VILPLLLAIAAPTDVPPARQSPVDAERAFAADAQKLGQWTAFRAWSAPDATMFTPQPVRARDFLSGRADPPSAVYWWPGASFISCDGSTAVNTGPWVREGGKAVGYFTTVWQRQSDRSWKWVYDGGDALKQARGQGGDIAPRRATCPNLPVSAPPRIASPANARRGAGGSHDRTLNWQWSVAPDGSRTFVATAWDGGKHVTIVEDRVDAPPK
jgi:hypothetical protein